MTLTFDPVLWLIRIQVMSCIHPPSFIKIRPRTSEMQKFDLWPRWPWPLTQFYDWFPFKSCPAPTHQVSSESDQGPRRYRNSTFDLDDLDLRPSSMTHSYSSHVLHPPIKFHHNQIKDLGDNFPTRSRHCMGWLALNKMAAMDHQKSGTKNRKFRPQKPGRS